MSIILFIVILGVLILAHEFGHFIAAKRAGIRVDEFGIGFPPRLWGKTVGETTYSLNTFPVGGFVKIFGENPDEESLHGADSARSFVRKSKLIQAWVISAGVVFNLLLAWVLLSLGFMIGVPYSPDDTVNGARVTNAELTITQVKPNSPADVAGLRAGDKIISLASGKDVLEGVDVDSVQKFIARHDELELTYSRGGEMKTASASTKDGLVEGRRAIGISMDMAGILKLPVHQALYAGAETTLLFTASTAVGIVSFFMNIFSGSADFSQVSGPVGIVGVVGASAALGFVYILSLMALISINLAVINLLPFPALDGGRLLFILIEVIKGSPIKPAIANAANGIGFILLILLMIVVTYNDIVKIVVG
ncbi:MAG: RIP metalloprotease RseP [Patescibacteria group bacterium]